MSEKVYGCKLLEPDGTDLCDPRTRRAYRYAWQDVPEGVYVAIKGVYVAVTGGAEYGGVPTDAVVRWFVCDPASEVEIDPDFDFDNEVVAYKPLPEGVRCFRRVRMLRRKPKGMLPLAEKRGRTIIVRGYYPNGQQAYRWEYRDGRLHGVTEVWRRDGSRFYRHPYRDGRLHGISETWWPNGQLAYRHKYRDGKLIA